MRRTGVFSSPLTAPKVSFTCLVSFKDIKHCFRSSWKFKIVWNSNFMQLSLRWVGGQISASWNDKNSSTTGRLTPISPELLWNFATGHCFEMTWNFQTRIKATNCFVERILLEWVSFAHIHCSCILKCYYIVCSRLETFFQTKKTSSSLDTDFSNKSPNTSFAVAKTCLRIKCYSVLPITCENGTELPTECSINIF